MKKNLLLILIMPVAYFISPNFATAQDVHFSQFWMAPLFQNPAACGVNADLQAIVNYKDQWRSVASPYKTMNVSLDMKLNKKKIKTAFLAAGINVFNDVAGDSKMKKTQANLSLAAHVLLSKQQRLGLGFMGGFAQQSVNYSALQWASQYDGMNYNSALSSNEPTPANSFNYADLGAGLIWSYNQGNSYISSNNQLFANAGISVFHPHQPKFSYFNSDEKLNMKLVVHGNVLYGIKNSGISLTPGFLFYSQGSSKELLMGSMIRYILKEQSKYTKYIQGSAFSVGAYYRNKDAVIISSLLEFSGYAVGFSYDLNVSGLTTVSTGRGGFEVSLKFVTPNPFSQSAPSSPKF